MLSSRSVGFLFPGQGAQFVGMGKDFHDQFLTAKALFENADQILGYSLSRICFEGPEDVLTRTLYAQPAIFVTSLAALAVLNEKFPELQPAFCAGLSLGEFTALTAAGSLTFEAGLRLVKARAEAMERAAEKNKGTMASIMGLTEADCRAIAQEAGCEVANLNAPDQIVLSGTVESIEKACRLAEQKDAKRALSLKVGGAFHSSLMNDAREDLRKALALTAIKQPGCTFIPNALARKVSEPDQIRELLAKQLVSPVRWVETMLQAEKENLACFIEVGPGKVLKGLARKSAPKLVVEPCGNVSDLQKLEQVLANAGTRE